MSDGSAPRRRIAADPLFDRADRPSGDVATLHFNVIAIVIASASWPADIYATLDGARRRRARPDTRTACRASALRNADSPAHRCSELRARVSAV